MFLTLSDTYVVMPIVVHEFVDCPVPEQELEWPQELEKRCCLFRQRIPPDQLNPRVSMHTRHYLDWNGFSVNTSPHAALWQFVASLQ